MKAMYTDDQLIEMIRQDGAPLEKALRWLDGDKAFRQRVFQHVTRNGGSREDAEEIWNSSLVTLVSGIQQAQYAQRGALRAYWYGICKGLSSNFFRNKGFRQLVPTEDEHHLDTPNWETPAHLLLTDEMKGALMQALSKLSEKCRDLLLLWSQSFSMAEIAGKLGYADEDSAKNRRRNCHLSLMKYLDEHPMIKQELEDLWNWKNTTTR